MSRCGLWQALPLGNATLARLPSAFAGRHVVRQRAVPAFEIDQRHARLLVPRETQHASDQDGVVARILRTIEADWVREGFPGRARVEQLLEAELARQD